MILLLHTLIEAAVGLLFLFYPGAPELVPGFGGSSGPAFELLMKMYGVAALFLAALSLITYLRREDRMLMVTVTGLLTLFHFGLAVVLAFWNPDPRAMLLHFLLAIFLGGRYVATRRLDWATK